MSIIPSDHSWPHCHRPDSTCQHGRTTSACPEPNSSCHVPDPGHECFYTSVSSSLFHMIIFAIFTLFSAKHFQSNNYSPSCTTDKRSVRYRRAMCSQSLLLSLVATFILVASTIGAQPSINSKFTLVRCSPSQT